MRYYCSVCEETISENVYRYSIDHFGKALCIAHQKKGTTHAPRRYTCSVCKDIISENVYRFSTEHCGTPLCMRHQKTVTPQSLKLSKALDDMDVKHTLEYGDGFKHVDIAIEWAKLYLELDGKQHGFSPKQMCADDDRDSHSQKEGFYTKRIPNAWVDENVNRLALSIASLANKRYKAILEEEKKYTLTGIVKSVLGKLSETLEGYE